MAPDPEQPWLASALVHELAFLTSPVKGRTCSTPRPFLAQTSSGSRASRSVDEDWHHHNTGFNWSLWAKVSGEGRADHEEGLVGRGGSAEPEKVGCFLSGHPDPVTRTCMSWRDIAALHDTLRLHSIHCCVHQTCYVTATATQPSLIKRRLAEDGGGPLDASRLPCEIGQLGKCSGQGGASSHPHKSGSTTQNCKWKKWSSAPAEWEAPLVKPKVAFERQKARQPSLFPARAVRQQTGWPGPPVNQIILRCTEVTAVNTFLTTAPCTNLSL